VKEKEKFRKDGRENQCCRLYICKKQRRIKAVCMSRMNKKKRGNRI